jgi:hypothetical protein
MDKVKISDMVNVIDKPDKRKRMASIATVVDGEGNAIFHIVSTRWSKIGIGVLTGLLLIITCVAIMAYINAARIDRLEGKQDASDTRQDASDVRQTKSETNANK